MTVTTEPTLLDAHGLQARLQGASAPRLLDVRTQVEYEAAHIPGSHNLPLDTLQQHRSHLRRHLTGDVVLVCRSGARARQAERALVGAGGPRLRVLDGGMTAWEDAGGAVERGAETWEIERQVRLTAGSLVLASVLGSVVVPRLRWVAAGVGTGLSVAALTDTCALGNALARMPWNRGAAAPDVDAVVRVLSDA